MARPHLTREDGYAILGAAWMRNRPALRDWLFLRLIMEVGLTTGQIAGFQYRRTNVPPLTIDDLHENYIVVSGHGIKQYLDASPELIERLKKFYKPNPRRRIFETIADNVRRRVRFAVERAGIKGAKSITPDSLRFLLKPEAPKIVLNVGEFNSKDIIRAEKWPSTTWQTTVLRTGYEGSFVKLCRNMGRTGGRPRFPKKSE